MTDTLDFRPVCCCWPTDGSRAAATPSRAVWRRPCSSATSPTSSRWSGTCSVGSRPPGASTPRSRRRRARSSATSLGRGDRHPRCRVLGADDVAVPARGQPRQGRQLLRSAREIWPSPWLDLLAEVDGGPHQPVVLGVTVGAAGGEPIDAATIALHHLTSAVATAAVRLLGLDPVALAGVSGPRWHRPSTASRRRRPRVWTSTRP